MNWLRSLVRLPLDFALPRRCAACGDVLAGEGGFCADCWPRLQHLPVEGCRYCCTPMSIAGGACASCLLERPAHDGVLAAVRYGDVARDLVLRLKYGRKPGCAKVMARLLVQRARLFPGAVLVPVPLHRWRLWWRGFNQSQMIAAEIARETRQLLWHDLLYRRKRTRALGGLSRRARAREVRAVFALKNGASSRIKGRDILLVDDVYTTGATANSCAHLLKRAGAAKVTVLCWARVIQDDG